MFGTQRRARRPILLVLVFGAFLALVGTTAAAQAVLVSSHVATGALNDVVASDAATIRAFVNAWVDPDALVAGDGEAGTGEVDALEAQLATLLRPGELLAVEIRRPDGTVVASAGPADIELGGAAGFEEAAAEGRPRASLGGTAGTQRIEEHLPLLVEGRVLGVVSLARDGEPVLARLAAVRRDVVVLTLAAALVAAVLLFAIFRAAQGRLSRQTAALADAARRDPLTGVLNHGAVVEHLAAAVEASRPGGTPIGLALVDIDNFRLLNDNHGHGAGDDALRTVLRLLLRELPAGVVTGRYGPDEFVVVAPARHVHRLEPALAALRTALADASLEYDGTERLPITISAGVCTWPEAGEAVTTVLASVAGLLEEAKASGGDTVCVAGPADAPAAAPRAAGFDVLQGLVLAVDTKDRYTRRHSEDVARYARFLAEAIGTEPELLRAIEMAGLLHDVGKIGIPDEILRKPGPLTDAEYEVVKQHVALGHLIVRDVPDAEQVRAGIRHHHERWDGKGYLDRLAGDEIPLVARILAVGDAFSAMTTTRPYRKALDVAVALRRLEDAAGTQLEERLVRAFVGAMESHPAPPLPGQAPRVRSRRRGIVVPVAAPSRVA